MPKYCKECCLQGHDENNRWTIHPELYGDKKGKDGTKWEDAKKDSKDQEQEQNFK